MSDHDAKGYWKSSIKIVLFILTIWFIVSFGGAILFKESLDSFKIGGAPFGFWMAQQGAIVVFVLLLITYAFLMNRLDEKHGYNDVVEETGPEPEASSKENEDSKESE